MGLQSVDTTEELTLSISFPKLLGSCDNSGFDILSLSLSLSLLLWGLRM